MFQLSNRPQQAQQQMAALHAWVLESLDQHGVWQVRTPDGDWFCPYCARSFCFGTDLRTQPEQISDHLATGCDPFDEVGSVPIFPESELRRRSLGPWIREWLKTDTAWHVRDPEHYWVCPYCTDTTTVQIVDGRVNREVQANMLFHVLECDSFDPMSADNYRPAQEIHRQLSRRTGRTRMVDRIKHLIEHSEAWRVSIPDGRWACPYCRKPVKDVLIQVPIDLTLNAPPKIMQHLTQACPAYRERRDPATSAGELYKRATGDTPTQTMTMPSPPAEAPEAKQPAPQQPSAIQSELMEKALSMAMDLERRAVEMDQDLSQARVRQLAMLPDAPELPGFDIAVTYKPCSHLGGDFYDFNHLDDGRIGIAIGDVTGHGATAALVMAITKKVLSMASRLDPEPERSVDVTNEEMCKDLDSRTFVTLWYGVLEPDTGLLRFVRAGHDPLLVYNPNREQPLRSYKPNGMAVGLTAGPRFEKMLEPVDLQLMAGDTLVLWTDGVTEIQGPDGEDFGQERLEEVIAAAPADASANDLLEQIEVAARRFAGTRPLEDDLTLLVVRYDPT